MHFEYEIPIDEYAAAQVLYHQLNSGRSRLLGRSILWIFAGLVLIVVGGSEKSSDLASILLVTIGAWWVYAGGSSVFLTSYYRRAYRNAGLAGEVYKADVSESGFEITSKTCMWRVNWPGVRIKGENKRVFLFYSYPYATIFIFGKKYLNTEQQQELRRLSGMSKL